MREQTEPRGDSRASLIGVGFTLLLNIIAGAWWASGVSADLKHLTDAVTMMQATQYTKGEARSDFRNVELQVVEIARRVNSLEEHKGPR